jgi:nitrogen fixation NifU-like protein
MFSQTIMEYSLAPYHRGAFPEANAVGQEGIEGEGAFVQIALRVQEGRVTQAYFQTYNCPSAVACGSWLVKWLEGQTIPTAASLEASDLMRVLGGLPLGKEHCAKLAVKALRHALQQVAPEPHAGEKHIDRQLSNPTVIKKEDLL